MLEYKEYKLENIPVRINKKIKETLDLYKKFFVPRQQLLSDFFVVKVKCRDSELTPINPWKYYHKKDGAESGVSLTESVFTFGAMKLRDEMPTDVIRAAFYGDRNDSEIECGLLLKKFLTTVEENATALIVNPSPDMILIFEEERMGSGKNIYCVVDETIAGLYRIQFPNSVFFTYDDSPHIKFDNMLIVNRDCALDKIKELVKLMQYCKGDILAELPNTYIDNSRPDFHGCLIQNNYSIDSIVLLPSNVTVTRPRKKCIICLKKIAEKKEFSLMNSVYDRKKGLFQIIDEGLMINNQVYWEKPYTVIQFWDRRALDEKKKEPQYDKSKVYCFSDEIELSYAIYSERKNRYEGKCWYRKLTGVNPLEYGKRVSAIIGKGLRAERVDEIVNNLWKIVFDERVYPYIYTDVKEKFIDNGIEVCLKTMWVIYRNDLSGSTVYDENIFTELFSSSSSRISGFKVREQTDKELIGLLSQQLQIEEENIPQRYYVQLDLLLNIAKKDGIIRYNPLTEVLQSVRKRVSERQQDIRQALTKKSFSEIEEERIFNYSMELVWSEPLNRKIPRCIDKSIALSGIIRFFTGMSIREVCALKWGDFEQIEETDEYKINITKFLDMKGNIISHAQREDWKKFRCVSVARPLKIILLERRAHLINMGIEEQVVQESPIILAREEIKSMRKGGRSLFCKPSKVQQYCRTLLEQAQIPEQLLLLPDANGELTTDIYKYHGDIFVSNIKKQLNHICGFTSGEICYMVGLTPQDTFSKHYCDYSNELLLYAMVEKMNRWTAKYEMQLYGKTDSVLKKGNVVFKDGIIKSGPYSDCCSALELVIKSEQKTTVNIKLSIQNEHGATVNITKYGSDDK